jgi:hypothetical protein
LGYSLSVLHSCLVHFPLMQLHVTQSLWYVGFSSYEKKAYLLCITGLKRSLVSIIQLRSKMMFD